MAAGRCGSVLGPLVVGQLVGDRLPIQAVFCGMGAMVVIGAVAALALVLRAPPSSGAPAE